MYFHLQYEAGWVCIVNIHLSEYSLEQLNYGGGGWEGWGVQLGCKETLTHLTPPCFLFLFRELPRIIYFHFTQFCSQDVCHKTKLTLCMCEKENQAQGTANWPTNSKRMSVAKRNSKQNSNRFTDLLIHSHNTLFSAVFRNVHSLFKEAAGAPIEADSQAHQAFPQPSQSRTTETNQIITTTMSRFTKTKQKNPQPIPELTILKQTRDTHTVHPFTCERACTCPSAHSAI